MRFIDAEFIAEANNHTKRKDTSRASMGVYLTDRDNELHTIVVRQGSSINYIRIEPISQRQLSNLIVSIHAKERCEFIQTNMLADSTLMEMCKEQKCRILPTNLYLESNNPNTYADKRSQFYKTMKDWLWTVSEPITDEDLEYELLQVECGLDDKGRLAIESYEGIRKRGLTVPGIVEALVLTFAYYRAGTWGDLIPPGSIVKPWREIQAQRDLSGRNILDFEDD